MEDFAKMIKTQLDETRKSAKSLSSPNRELILNEIDNIEKSIADADMDKIMATIKKLNDTSIN